jgi:type I restriction enzyme, S subunit
MKGKRRTGRDALREVPYLRVANVQRGSLDLSEIKLIAASESEIEKLQLRKGDVLFNEGGDRDKLGRGCVWNSELPECIHQNHVFRARIHPERALPEWVSAFGNSQPAQNYFLASGRQTTNLASINMTVLGDLPIPTPPLSEQRLIVAKLEALQSRSRRARESLDAVPPLLEKLRQSILAAAFRGDLTKHWRAKHKDVEPATELLKRIRNERRKKWEEAELAKMKPQGRAPADDRRRLIYQEQESVSSENLTQLPSGWCWANLREIAALFNGDRGKNYPNRSEYVPAGVPFINAGHIQPDGSISLQSMNFITRKTFDSLSGGKIERGDLLYCLRGTIGKTAFVDTITEGAIASSLVIIRPDHDALAQFLFYFLLSPQAAAEVRKYDNGTAQPNLAAESVSQYLVPIPPADELRKIAEIIAKRLGGVSRMEQLIASSHKGLSQLESSVLAKAFQGELVPQDPSDEPAEALLARLRQEKSPAEKPAARRRRSEAAQ